MTGPTTAMQLLDLAALELQQMGKGRSTQEHPSAAAAALASAWPEFLRAGTHLVSALQDGPDARPAPPTTGTVIIWPTASQAGQPIAGGDLTPRYGTGPDGSATSPGAADGHRRLLRSAELLAAAADLVRTRDRRALSREDVAVDAALAARCLVTGAVLVCQAVAPDLTLLATTASAAAAATRWSSALPAPGPGVHRGSLHDPVALPVPSAQPHVKGDPIRSTALAEAALHWQRVATAVANSPVPAVADLQHIARTAGRLLAVSQVLLRAHPPGASRPSTPPPPGAARALADDLAVRLRHAGLAWNHAAEQWQTLRTGGTPDRDVAEASSSLAAAVDAATGTGPGWASLTQVRERLDAREATDTASTLLAIAQALAEQQAALTTTLGSTGALYSPARRLPPSLERWDARVRGHWVPVTEPECADLVEAYRALPALTSTARLAYTAAMAAPGATEQLAPPPIPAVSTSVASDTPRSAAVEAAASPDTLAMHRWQPLLGELDARLSADPHCPALAAALDRIHLAGDDVPTALRFAAAQPLPSDHPARALHNRLTDTCPAAITPYTATASAPAPPARVPPATPDRPPAAHRARRRTGTAP